MLGRAGWGPIGRFSALQNLDYWKWMERFFGLVMGVGVAIGLRRLARQGLAPVDPSPLGKPLRAFSLIVLLLVLPWHNFDTNLRFWLEKGHLRDSLLGISPTAWVLLLGTGLTIVGLSAVRLHLQNRLLLAPGHPLGRAQLLLLFLMWLFVVADLTKSVSLLHHKSVLSVHVSFWITALLITLLLLLTDWPVRAWPSPTVPLTGPQWRPGRGMLLAWLAVPILLLLLTAFLLTTRLGPLPGSHQRFGGVGTVPPSP